MTRWQQPQLPERGQRGPVPGPRRTRRTQRVSELRAQGRYGPELREVLPAFAGLGLAALGTVCLLIWLQRTSGVLGVTLGVILLAPGTVVAVRVRRAVVRRRGGRYTAAELALLDERGLAEAAARILQRDGWQVVDLTLQKGRRRLHARDRQGRQLDVAFRSGATAEEDRNWRTALLETGRPGAARPIQVIVHPGGFSRADVLWAARQGDVHLLHGRQLQRWATGASLAGAATLTVCLAVGAVHLDRGGCSQDTLALNTALWDSCSAHHRKCPSRSSMP
ncbi:hypothetical protein [Streptomyces sp. NPDC053069]|uniref:hypothetical protein n=1 Tax=Streptomyces sp. NPDC053069 TaxID=3365695 RepID=UPI0037D3D893